MNKLILVILGVVIFFSCDKKERMEYIGLYGMDKYTIRNPTNNVDDYTHLEIKLDSKFSIVSNNSIIEGKWEIISQKKSEKVFNFTFNGKTIVGKLRGNVFYFVFPNDFHNGKYQSLLYIKLKK